MEQKLIDKKMKVLTWLIGFFFLVLLGRLGYMQIIESNRYRTLATQNHQRLIKVEAPRGEILDLNGVRLVSNKPVYTISLVYLGSQDSGPVIKRLAALLEGGSTFQGLSAEQIEQEIQEKIKGHQRLYEPVRVAVNVPQETVNRIEEQRLELPGINIDVEPVRYYPFGDLLGEVLGYVREITGEQLLSRSGDGYDMGDSYGQVGLENSFEGYLRGVKGARQVEVDAQGRPVKDLGLKQPVPGNNLVLTIDNQLQRVTQDAVAAAVEETRHGIAKVPAGTPITGAAVVIDVNTGDILAMASVPSYDLNIFSQPLQAKKYSELLATGALRNNAIQTTYTPGSTFKMATLSALLEGKIVTPQTTISDPGYYKGKKDWQPGGHGQVDAVGALKNSCDTYFYMFGAMAGPELIGKYAGEYGLGKLTGIELPGEETGRVASRETKKKSWAGNEWESQWHEYDSMDMAIGQQESKFTALQLANYVASIANGGTLYQPHIVKKVVGPDGAELKTYKPEVIKKVNVSPETLEILRKGMREVARGNGTGSAAFWTAPYSVAGKTGTAEVGDAAQNAHALYVSYAPYEKPEVAVSVIIEYGYKGSSLAGPTTRKILDEYFALKKEPVGDKKPNLTSGPAPASAPAPVLAPVPAQTTAPATAPAQTSPAAGQNSDSPSAAGQSSPGNGAAGRPIDNQTTPAPGSAVQNNSSGATGQSQPGTAPGAAGTPAPGGQTGRNTSGSGASPGARTPAQGAGLPEQTGSPVRQPGQSGAGR